MKKKQPKKRVPPRKKSPKPRDRRRPPTLARTGPDVIEINVSDVISVNDVANVSIEPVTARLAIEGTIPGVVLSEAQRSLLRRVLQKVLSALYVVEGGVEVTPDGTIRFLGRLRT